MNLKQPDNHAPGIAATFHPEGHDFANVEELMHWIATGEKTTINKKSWNKGGGPPMTQGF